MEHLRAASGEALISDGAEHLSYLPLLQSEWAKLHRLGIEYVQKALKGRSAAEVRKLLAFQCFRSLADASALQDSSV